MEDAGNWPLAAAGRMATASLYVAGVCVNRIGTAGTGILLAGAYEDGRGADLRGGNAEAIEKYREAAASGDARGECVLGGVYMQGFKVREDRAEGMRWRRQAAERAMHGASTFQSMTELSRRWLSVKIPLTPPTAP